jgi:thiol-disulfide isomerase/thioredoxin
MRIDRIAIAVTGSGFLAALATCAPPPPAEPAVPQKAIAERLPQQAGVGVALRIEDGKVFVNKVLPDTPAARSHLVNANDQIIAIAENDGEPVEVVGTTDVAKVVGMIRGPVQSVVRLTIIPEGRHEKDEFVVSLVRGEIKELAFFSDGRLLPVGTAAPNFKFTRLGDGKEADLSEFAGHIVVVEFWASWCGPCISAADHLESVLEQHPEWMGRVEILVVSVDEKREDAAKIFANKHWSKTSIVWAGPDVLKLYRVSGLPTMFVIDRDGLITAVNHRLDVPELIRPLLR